MACKNEILLKNKFGDKLNNESQTLRSKSQVLRNEAQSLRNKSQEPRNESLELRNEAQVLRNESQELRNDAQILRNDAQIPKNKSWILRSKSQLLRNEAQSLRNKSQELRNEAQVLRNEAQVLRNESQELRNEAQVLRNKLFEYDEEMYIPIIESNKTDNNLLVKYNDIDCGLDDELKGLTEGDLDTDTEEEEMNIPIIDLDDELNELAEQQPDMDTADNERAMHQDKINKLIDHANLLARIRNDFSMNVNEICVLMNELDDEIYSDDSWLRLVELNKINTLLDESLDYVWKMVYGKNREKHEKINIDKHKNII